MPYTEIEVERRGSVTIIRFNRPEVRNCVGPTTHRELVAAWTDFRDDDTALVAIITGAGDAAFCSGGDLKAADGLVPTDADEIAAHGRGERPGILGPTRWTDISKPILAAVNGVAYAGGLEWACFADLRIAEEHATFGVTCRRWNIGLGDGGTQRLPRIVGMGRAMELILTGRVIDAREAERIGLVNEVVPRGRSLARALELAEQLAALPQPAMRTDKEAALRGFGRPLAEGLAIEADCFFRSIHQPETLEGLRRFAERDHPDLRSDRSGRTPRRPSAIRRLEPADADEFLALRRRALSDVPLAFASSPEDDVIADVAAAREHLARAPESVIFGGFDGDTLVGCVGLYRDRHLKMAHKVHLWGLYVAAEARLQGVASRLVEAAIAHARTLPGVEAVQLGVSEAAAGARRLYERAGFRVWGTDPDALRHDGRAVAEHWMILPLERRD